MQKAPNDPFDGLPKRAGYLVFKPFSFKKLSQRSIVVSVLLCAGFLPSAWAGNAELVIPPNSHAMISKSLTTSQQSIASASAMNAMGVIDTPTSFFAFTRYPDQKYYPLTPWNNDAQTMQGVALIYDDAITVWWSVQGIWNNDGIEDWECRLTKPDGTVVGLHWRSEMKTVNNIYQKCFVSSDPVTGVVRGQFCADDPTYGKAQVNSLLFGLTRNREVDQKIEVWNANLTHNGMEIWTTPWLLGDLQLINPNVTYSWRPDLLSLIDPDGQVTSDLQKIKMYGQEGPTHVVADGVTPLLYLVGSTPTVPVTLKVASGSTGDGTLTDLYGGSGQTGSTSISTNLQVAPNGNRYGVGRYTAPPEFSSTPSSQLTRTVQLDAQFAVPWQSYPAVFPVTFELMRRPLILIHGMWSKPEETWKALTTPALCDPRLCFEVDWSPANTQLSKNTQKVGNTVKNVLAFLRYGLGYRSVAITQMDVIAHSAGGPLFRLYMQSPSGDRRDNLFLGDFCKMLTVGSPHHGTPIADFVLQLLVSPNPLTLNIVRYGFASQGFSITNGIITDLQTTSPAMRAILPTPGKAHAWVCDLPSIPTSGREKRLWHVLRDICNAPNVANNYSVCQGITLLTDLEVLRARVFNGQANDGLVAHDMQTGGVGLSAQTVLSNTPHTRETDAISPADLAAVLDDTGSKLDSGGFQ